VVVEELVGEPADVESGGLAAVAESFMVMRATLLPLLSP
jgi:hypothetical protein